VKCEVLRLEEEGKGLPLLYQQEPPSITAIWKGRKVSDHERVKIE
jgi:hypothetical protein